MSNELQDFLRLSYSELEDLNLHAKEQRSGACRCTRFKRNASST